MTFVARSHDQLPMRAIACDSTRRADVRCSASSEAFCAEMSKRIETYFSISPEAPTYGTIVLSTQ